MKRVINLDNWNRKEHFKFFSALDDPFWGITTTVDFTSIYQQSKNMEVSFFLYSVHFLLKCINATTAFKLRIENGEVVEYDKINISPTIGREDGTFGFGFFEYDTDLSLFIENADHMGLSTLYQLRGRVGRNSLESKCILISDHDSERLKIMETVYDGFEISEEDFKLRGSGDLFGIRQSGDMMFKIADLKQDYKILVQAKKDSLEYLKDHNYDNDPIKIRMIESISSVK